MNNVSKNIDKLKEKDLYGIILYAIYKCTNIQEYSTISELIYSMDKYSFLNLCSVFGGTTIKIPTINEVKIYTNALLIYQLMAEDNISFDEAYDKTGLDKEYKTVVAKIYATIKEIVSNYE